MTNAIFKSCLIALMLAVGAASSASADAYEAIKKAGKIRISTDFAVPPYGMLDGNMKPTGADIEVAQLLAKDWGVQLEFVQTTGASRIPNLLTNKADVVISSLAITPQRREAIDFSIPYLAQQTVIAAPADMRIATWEDLRGKTVAVARGTTLDADVSAVAPQWNITVKRYEDDATMFTAVISGQERIMAHADTTIPKLNERSPQLRLQEVVVLRTNGVGIGVKKGEPELVRQLNLWVEENLKTGKLSEISQKYFGKALPKEMPK